MIFELFLVGLIILLIPFWFFGAVIFLKLWAEFWWIVKEYWNRKKEVEQMVSHKKTLGVNIAITREIFESATIPHEIITEQFHNSLKKLFQAINQEEAKKPSTRWHVLNVSATIEITQYE